VVMFRCLVIVVDHRLQTNEYREIIKGAPMDSLFTGVHNDAQ